MPVMFSHLASALLLTQPLSGPTGTVMLFQTFIVLFENKLDKSRWKYEPLNEYKYSVTLSGLTSGVTSFTLRETFLKPSAAQFNDPFKPLHLFSIQTLLTLDAENSMLALP
jgi:hypothetical protein